MRLDLTAVEQFAVHLDGGVTTEQMLEHPAYRAVRTHARRCYGVDLGAGDVEAALRGEDSPFFGLRRVRDNLPRIIELLRVVRRRGDSWLADAKAALHVIAPGVDVSSITVYPIAGYDAGIGLDEAVCLNVNWGIYLDRPEELLYMMIHEATHVLYGRRQPIMDLADVRTRREWQWVFRRMTQDEGFAVYAPLALRRERGAMGDESHPILRDYQVIASPGRMAWCLERYREAARRLAGPEVMARDEYMKVVFGPHRLTYRVGCELVRRIAGAGNGGVAGGRGTAGGVAGAGDGADGRAAVAAAFAMSADEFMAKHGGLIGVSTA